MQTFMEKLQAMWAKGRFLCVGLDSDLKHKKFPKTVPVHPFAEGHDTELNDESLKQLRFNCHVVDTTKHIVGMYKPNMAFYGGDIGKRVLRLTIEYIRAVAPDVVVILDAKQGDIGNTNNGYVEDDFSYYDADAVTVHNYLGMTAMKPFLEKADRGIVVLCRTSNNGADEFQDRTVPVTDEEAESWGLPQSTTMPLYQLIAWRISREWNVNSNCAVVVGATYPGELTEVRRIVGNGFPILIPGVGAQGGEVDATVQAGQDDNGEGMIINSSRAILFPGSGDTCAEFSADAVRTAAENTHQQILQARQTV